MQIGCFHSEMKSFFCPITRERFIDPVITIADGHTYERHAIEAWLSSHQTSPLTGAILPSIQIVPNHTLRCSIEEFSRRERLMLPISSQLNLREATYETYQKLTIFDWLLSIGIEKDVASFINTELLDKGFLNMEYLILGEIDKSLLENIPSVKIGYIGKILFEISKLKKHFTKDVEDNHSFSLDDLLLRIKELEWETYHTRIELQKIQTSGNNGLSQPPHLIGRH